MTSKQRLLAMRATERLVPPEELNKLLKFKMADLGFGFDQFGMERESVLLAYAIGRCIYKYWFRVTSRGQEYIPDEGRVLIVPNHSGVLPIDAMMIWIDLWLKKDAPRPMRAVVDNFAGFLPFINTAMYRVGQVVGARRNFEDLLESNQLMAVFPEGAKGTGKLYKDRYKLIKFNVGFIELSIKHRVPIIPTAVVGCEEQYAMMYNVKAIAAMISFPYFPITPLFPLLGPLGMVPLPVRYHIRYGEPIHFYNDYGPQTLENPETVRMLADKVQLKVEEMIQGLLEERKGIFS